MCPPLAVANQITDAAARRNRWLRRIKKMPASVRL